MNQAKLAKKRAAKNLKRKGKKYNPHKRVVKQPIETLVL
jgi:hypothetical protein